MDVGELGGLELLCALDLLAADADASPPDAFAADPDEAFESPLPDVLAAAWLAAFAAACCFCLASAEACADDLEEASELPPFDLADDEELEDESALPLPDDDDSELELDLELEPPLLDDEDDEEEDDEEDEPAGAAAPYPQSNRR